MWSEIIQSFHDNSKQFLDIKNELHVSIYIKELLKEIIEFSLSDDNTLIIKKKEDNQILTFDKFYYWWNIDRFDELISEEEIFFNEFNDLKNKIIPAIEKIKQPVIKDEDTEEDKKKKQDKIKSNEEKISKLKIHIEKESEKFNSQINMIKRFRLIYPNYNSLERFTQNVIILLNAKEN